MDEAADVRTGIRGWLLIPTLWLVWAASQYAAGSIRFAKNLLTRGNASVFDQRSLIDLPFYLEFAALTFLLVFSCFVLYQFFGKRRKAPAWYIAFSLMALAAGIGKLLWSNSKIQAGIPMAIGELEVTIGWTILGAIWIPYLFASKRVKTTFVS